MFSQHFLHQKSRYTTGGKSLHRRVLHGGCQNEWAPALRAGAHSFGNTMENLTMQRLTAGRVTTFPGQEML